MKRTTGDKGRGINTEDYKCCIVCGKAYSEMHHVIFRSQARYMVNVPINLIPLCIEHHKGNNGPHKLKKVDLQYKKELQATLEKIFIQNYYTTKEIKNILQISESEAGKIVKLLPLGKEGYKRTDIIRRCMGGRLYD